MQTFEIDLERGRGSTKYSLFQDGTDDLPPSAAKAGNTEAPNGHKSAFFNLLSRQTVAKALPNLPNPHIMKKIPSCYDWTCAKCFGIHDGASNEFDDDRIDVRAKFLFLSAVAGRQNRKAILELKDWQVFSGCFGFQK
jgi:hypothetical protein